MKKNGVLNAQLSEIIARMGHTDHLVICDAGLPIPRSADIIDLAVTSNLPPFFDTLKVILSELQIQKFTIAEEIKLNNPALYDKIMKLLNGVAVEMCSHEQFKEKTRTLEIMAFVRTGETSPFANIILESGVTF